MKKEKIFCDQCGASLVVTHYKLGVCEFCNAQYHLDGYSGPITKSVSYEYNFEINDDALDNLYFSSKHVAKKYPYAVWLDGGVSVRSVTPSEYAVWTHKDKPTKETSWNSEKESTPKMTLMNQLKDKFLR